MEWTSDLREVEVELELADEVDDEETDRLDASSLENGVGKVMMAVGCVG